MPRKKTDLETNEPISELSAAPENQEPKKTKKPAAPRRSRAKAPAIATATAAEVILQIPGLELEEELKVAFRSVAKREPTGRSRSKPEPAAPAPTREKETPKPREGRG